MTPPRKDPTRPVKAYQDDTDGNQFAAVANDTFNQRVSEWPKYIAVFITLLGMIVGAAVWASNAHDNLKSFVMDQDVSVESNIKAEIREQYVPKYEFTAVQQILENQKLTLEKIEGKLDKVLEKPPR